MAHWTANHVVRIDGDRATGEADVDVTVQFRDGRWLIARREVSDSFDLDPPPVIPPEG